MNNGSSRLFAVLVFLICSCALYGADSAQDSGEKKADRAIRVAAASSLQFVLNDILTAFVEETGQPGPQVVYGSSGNLFRQIMQGAPYDMFLSADNRLVEKLEDATVAYGEGVKFAEGRLVLFVNTNSKLNLKNGLEAFKSALERGNIAGSSNGFKLAIANPRHAPYGRAAQQVLQSMGLWDIAMPHLVYAEKVSQAAQYVASGATELALISRSLAVSPVFQEKGHYELIAREHHQPVAQAIIQIKKTQSGDALFDFIRHAKRADDILRRYGMR